MSRPDIVLLSTMNISAPQRGHCVSDPGAAGSRRELGLNQRGPFHLQVDPADPTIRPRDMRVARIADLAGFVMLNRNARR
jgi:hypothetical protein